MHLNNGAEDLLFVSRNNQLCLQMKEVTLNDLKGQ